MNITHTKDTDCILDRRNICTICGTPHGEPCSMCNGRGFHRPTCTYMDHANHSTSVTEIIRSNIRYLLRNPEIIPHNADVLP